MAEGPKHEARRIGLDLFKAALQEVPGGNIALAFENAADAHRRRRRDYFIDQLLTSMDEELAGLHDEVSAERISDLVEHGLREAEKARSDEKIRLLAKVVAAGSRPDRGVVHVDQAHFVLDIVSNLEAPHIEVLRLVAGLTDKSPGNYQHFTGMWTTQGIQTAFPELGDLVVPVLATLLASGLVRNNQAGASIINEAWTVTAIGEWVLQRLAEIIANEPDRHGS